MLMFGRNAPDFQVPVLDNKVYEATTYQGQLRKRMAEMYDLVEANLSQAGEKQKKGYDANAKARPSFKIGLVMQFGSLFPLQIN